MAVARGLRCPSCGNRYPVDADQELVEFLPDGSFEDRAQQESMCWDEDAARDEILAAVSQSSSDTSDIFTKMPPLLPECEVDGKVCLDLGCGYGRTLLYTALNGRPAQSIGVDVSHVMLRKARAYARQRGLGPALARASVDALPLRTESVDFAYSSVVFIHLPKEVVSQALRETVRVLKPGGVALFENSFHCWLNPEGAQTKLITGLGSRWLRAGWVRTYRHAEVERLLREVGPVRSVEIGPERYTVLPKALFKLQLSPLKPVITRLNERASTRLRWRSMFVASWYVRLVK